MSQNAHFRRIIVRTDLFACKLFSVAPVCTVPPVLFVFSIFIVIMETRKPKKKISEGFGLGEALETFKAGPFPYTEDVLSHLYFHLWAMKKPDSDLACLSTTDSLLSLWAPSYLLNPPVLLVIRVFA